MYVPFLKKIKIDKAITLRMYRLNDPSKNQFKKIYGLLTFDDLS